jgi:hypothetical protein
MSLPHLTGNCRLLFLTFLTLATTWVVYLYVGRPDTAFNDNIIDVKRLWDEVFYIFYTCFSSISK